MNKNTNLRVLILGASGMLGNAMLRFFSSNQNYETLGSVRSPAAIQHIQNVSNADIISNVEVEDHDVMVNLITDTRPDVVINCIGVIKQIKEAEDPVTTIAINSLLPHRLARLCSSAGARLIHVSTDCVFTGAKGMYSEEDISDAVDLYGRSKFLGEVDYGNAITIRTSIIGHELGSTNGLVEWFLSMDQQVSGYTKAIFSGLPTIELARVIEEFIIPRPALRGLYHVSADPISKYDLLKLVAKTYRKSIAIVPDDKLVIDRSLSSNLFRKEVGYTPPSWELLVEKMRKTG